MLLPDATIFRRNYTRCYNLVALLLHNSFVTKSICADKNKAQQPLLFGDIYSKLLFSLENYGVRFELVFCVEIAAH